MVRMYVCMHCVHTYICTATPSQHMIPVVAFERAQRYYKIKIVI